MALPAALLGRARGTHRLPQRSHPNGDIHGWDATETALRGYVRVIAAHLGVPPEHTVCDVGDLAVAGIRVSQSLPTFGRA